jgi:hypothetical protein
MVQSKFNLAFWFMSYNIFFVSSSSELASVLSSLCRAFSVGAWVPPQGSFGPSATCSWSGIFGVDRPIEYPLAFFGAAVFLLTWHFITFTGHIYCTECGRSQLYRSVGAAAQFALSESAKSRHCLIAMQNQNISSSIYYIESFDV